MDGQCNIGQKNAFGQKIRGPKPELTEKEKREIQLKQQENKEKYEKISLEFKKTDEENFGPAQNPERMNVEKFKNYVASFGKCKTEGRLTITDNRTHEVYYDFRRLSFVTDDGEDAVASIRVMLSDRIANPFLNKKPAIFDIPFDVEYREKDGKKYISLKHFSRSGEKIIQQEFYIREL